MSLWRNKIWRLTLKNYSANHSVKAYLCLSQCSNNRSNYYVILFIFIVVPTLHTQSIKFKCIYFSKENYYEKYPRTIANNYAFKCSWENIWSVNFFKHLSYYLISIMLTRLGKVLWRRVSPYIYCPFLNHDRLVALQGSDYTGTIFQSSE